MESFAVGGQRSRTVQFRRAPDRTTRGGAGASGREPRLHNVVQGISEVGRTRYLEDDRVVLGQLALGRRFVPGWGGDRHVDRGLLPRRQNAVAVVQDLRDRGAEVLEEIADGGAVQRDAHRQGARVLDPHSLGHGRVGSEREVAHHQVEVALGVAVQVRAVLTGDATGEVDRAGRGGAAEPDVVGPGGGGEGGAHTEDGDAGQGELGDLATPSRRLELGVVVGGDGHCHDRRSFLCLGSAQRLPVSPAVVFSAAPFLRRKQRST